MNYTYSPIKIAIADDHEIFREGFKLLLKHQTEIELVGEAENGRQLLELVEMHSIDVVVLDIKMPVMDGIEACKELKKIYPGVKVIALSMFNDDSFIIDMLEAGATGYLLKNTNRAELLEAVKTVFEGRNFYSSETSAKLVSMIGQSKYNPYRSQPVARFTKREKDVIRLICEQYTNKEIAEKLGVSIRTVESHRENIQEKSGARNSIGVVIYAIKHDIISI